MVGAPLTNMVMTLLSEAHVIICPMIGIAISQFDNTWTM